MSHHDYMQQALTLAKRGMGYVNPNPMVGAIIVKDNKIIGEGYHKEYGKPHAEINAIESCGDKCIKGATIYVTLEPCSHYGKTPPCTDAIIQAGITHVVIGAIDKNPLVKNKGIDKLIVHGIQVTTGILEEECKNLNQIFFHYITTKKPYVTMKYAMTQDGKIATKTGESKWISCEASREFVHIERHKHMAIMVGLGTVLADNPMLDCRSSTIEYKKNPIRIICDTNLKVPPTAKIIQTAKEIPTIIATTITDTTKYSPYKDCQIIAVPKKGDHIDLEALMIILGNQNIDSILLEGGATLNWFALEAGIVQSVQTYIAPKIFGSKDAKTPVDGIGIAKVADHIALKHIKTTMLGADILIESQVINSCLQE